MKRQQAAGGNEKVSNEAYEIIRNAADLMECRIKKFVDYVKFRSRKKRGRFSYGRKPKIKRITMGETQGIAEQVLCEF